MHAEILAIGDEITSGQLLDTNTQWLSQRLEEFGIRTLYHTTVGDELEPCAAVFRQAMDRSDIVICTGGLGPTADDLTREALARAVGVSLVRNDKALEHIRQLFARRQREMPARNECQALFPEGADMIHNPNGTAPGVALEIARGDHGPCHFFALPGVPAEMKEMWADSLGTTIRRLSGGNHVVVRRVIKCFGAGESQIEAMLPDLIRRGRQPTVGINASKTTIILRIKAEGLTEEACREAIDPTVATIHQCLGNLVYGEGDDELQDAVLRLLSQRKKTLATAEWGTTGMVAEALDTAANATSLYRGGLVVADRSVLGPMLDVSDDLLAEHPPTSAELVRAMAIGCRKRFATDYALAVGQFPEFDPASSKPGMAHCALATSDGVEVFSRPHASHPATLKILATKMALNAVRLTLLEKP